MSEISNVRFQKSSFMFSLPTIHTVARLNALLIAVIHSYDIKWRACVFYITYPFSNYTQGSLSSFCLRETSSHLYRSRLFLSIFLAPRCEGYHYSPSQSHHLSLLSGSSYYHDQVMIKLCLRSRCVCFKSCACQLDDEFSGVIFLCRDHCSYVFYHCLCSVFVDVIEK